MKCFIYIQEVIFSEIVNVFGYISFNSFWEME